MRFAMHFQVAKQTDSESIPLSQVESGQTVRLIGQRAGRSLAARLQSMGLGLGAVVRVVNNARRGPMLVSIGDARISIGRNMAAKIITVDGLRPWPGPDGRERPDMNLDEMVPGDRCRVKKVRAPGWLGQRLRDMGFFPGVELRVLRNAPLVDPVELQLGDTNVSLRHEEAGHIEVVPE
jgi:ferrous iron transport protein A